MDSVLLTAGVVLSGVSFYLHLEQWINHMFTFDAPRSITVIQVDLRDDDIEEDKEE